MNGAGPNTIETAAPTTDESLLLRWSAESDEEALRALMKRYEGELYHYLCRYMHNATAAEEVMQAAFERLAERSDRFWPGHRVRPWLYTIATHLAIDALRRSGRHPAASLDAEHADDAALRDLLVGHSDEPSARLEETERACWLHRAVAELPEHLRQAVELIYFDGLKYNDAAERLAIPSGTLKSRLHEALVRLHRAFERDEIG